MRLRVGQRNTSSSSLLQGKTGNATQGPGPTPRQSASWMRSSGDTVADGREETRRGRARKEDSEATDNARTPVGPLFLRATTKRTPCTPKLRSSYGFLLWQILAVPSRCNKLYCNLLTQTLRVFRLERIESQKPNLHVSKHITLMC
jgi:hypothetical protein